MYRDGAPCAPEAFAVRSHGMRCVQDAFRTFEAALHFRIAVLYLGYVLANRVQASTAGPPSTYCPPTCYRPSGNAGPEGILFVIGAQSMDGTTKRLKIADVITNMFRSVLALSPGAILLPELDAYLWTTPSTSTCKHVRMR